MPLLYGYLSAFSRALCSIGTLVRLLVCFDFFSGILVVSFRLGSNSWLGPFGRKWALGIQREMGRVPLWITVYVWQEILYTPGVGGVFALCFYLRV